MDIEARQKIQKELAPGERVHWAGRPQSKWPGAMPHLAQAAFMIPWTGFAIFWTLGATGITGFSLDPFSLIFPAVGGAFNLIGLVVFVRSALKVLGADKVTYAVTDQRALIVRDNGDVRSLSGAALGQIRRKGDDQTGSLYFGPAAAQRSSREVYTPPDGFHAIKGARQVEALIREHLTAPD